MHHVSFILGGRGERKHVLALLYTFQKEETSLTEDGNHLEEREIWGWGFLFENWQLNAGLPDQK